MTYSLEQFCEDGRASLRKDRGPAGRECLARYLEKLLFDADFVAEHLDLKDGPVLRRFTSILNSISG